MQFPMVVSTIVMLFLILRLVGSARHGSDSPSHAGARWYWSPRDHRLPSRRGQQPEWRLSDWDPERSREAWLLNA